MSAGSRPWTAGLPRVLSLAGVGAGLAIAAVLLATRSGESLPGQRLYERHCSTCHGDKGGRIPAAPLDSPVFLRQLGDAGIARAIADGKGMMPAWGKEQGGPLDHKQIQSLVAYLLNMQRIERLGFQVYRNACRDCHGEKGNRIPAVPLSSWQFLDGKSDEQLLTVVGDGKGSMPAFRKERGGPLNDAELIAVVEYLRISSGSTGSAGEAGASSTSPSKTDAGSAGPAGTFSGLVRHVDGWTAQHPSAVKTQGAQLCYQCHQNSFCAGCHTGGRVGK